MEVFDIFSGFNFILIGKYMAAELFIGILAGIVVRYTAKFNAGRASDVRVFPATEYSSIHFGRKFPTGSLDPFNLPLEFVIVQYANNEIIYEIFFTSLGNSVKAEYQNGEYRGYAFSALSSPVYLFTVVIPILVGFYSVLLSFIDKVSSPLLLSGLVWMFITSLIPTFYPTSEP